MLTLLYAICLCLRLKILLSVVIIRSDGSPNETNSCILMVGSIVGWIVWLDIVLLHAKQFRDYSLHWNAIYSPFWKILIMLLNTFRLLFNFEITRCNLPALKKVTQIWILQCRMILWTWWWWIWWEDWVKFITLQTLHLGQAMKIEVL